MTLRVVFRRAARAEFDAAALWYEDRQAGLGAQFVSEINRVVELVSNHPERFPQAPRNSMCAGTPLSVLSVLSPGGESCGRPGRVSRTTKPGCLAGARVTVRAACKTLQNHPSRA